MCLSNDSSSCIIRLSGDSNRESKSFSRIHCPDSLNLVPDTSRGRRAATLSNSYKVSQGDRTVETPSKHLDDVSPVPKIPDAKMKRKQSAQLVWHKENVIKRKETSRNEDFYRKEMTKRRKFRAEEESEDQLPTH
jgi:hypothetical protein